MSTSHHFGVSIQMQKTRGYGNRKEGERLELLLLLCLSEESNEEEKWGLNGGAICMKNKSIEGQLKLI